MQLHTHNVFWLFVSGHKLCWEPIITPTWLVPKGIDFTSMVEREFEIQIQNFWQPSFTDGHRRKSRRWLLETLPRWNEYKNHVPSSDFLVPVSLQNPSYPPERRQSHIFSPGLSMLIWGSEALWDSTVVKPACSLCTQIQFSHLLTHTNPLHILTRRWKITPTSILQC